MIAAAALLLELRTRGLTVRLVGSELRVSPAHRVTREIAARIRSSRDQLVRELAGPSDHDGLLEEALQVFPGSAIVSDDAWAFFVRRCREDCADPEQRLALMSARIDAVLMDGAPVPSAIARDWRRRLTDAERAWRERSAS